MQRWFTLKSNRCGSFIGNVSLLLLFSNCVQSVCSASSEELLDENNHFALLNGAGAILIEGGEDLIESLIREFIS